MRHLRPRLALALLVLAVSLAPALLLAAANPGTWGPIFRNATYTGPPICRDILVPSLNPATPLHLCAVVRRPEEGGGLWLVTLFTADGEQVRLDMRDSGVTDCFGADPWASRFTLTLKVVVWCKVGDGNDRVPIFVDTGLRAIPPVYQPIVAPSP